MNIKFIVFLTLNVIIVSANNKQERDLLTEKQNLIVELTDEKWDQIQKGQWLVGL